MFSRLLGHYVISTILERFMLHYFTRLRHLLNGYSILQMHSENSPDGTTGSLYSNMTSFTVLVLNIRQSKRHRDFPVKVLIPLR